MRGGQRSAAELELPSSRCGMACRPATKYSLIGAVSDVVSTHVGPTVSSVPRMIAIDQFNAGTYGASVRCEGEAVISLGYGDGRERYWLAVQIGRTNIAPC